MSILITDNDGNPTRHPETLAEIRALFEGTEHQELYERDSETLRARFEASPFWTKFLGQLEEFTDRQQLEHGLPLVAHRDHRPEVVKKPWSSVLDKIYRKNFLNNERFPEAPNDGWITETNWLQRINDIIRTTVTVRYLDGISDVLGLLKAAANDEGIAVKVDHKAQNEGYYAVHVAVPMRLRVGVDETGLSSLFAGIEVEVQICTQIQEVIRSLTHTFYEARRLRKADQANPWQWNFKSAEFTPNYLGHLLHYADGAIANLRRGTEESNTDE